MLDRFEEIWLVDFEFNAPPGERPEPLCLVAREFRTNRLLRVWFEDWTEPAACPIRTDSDVLFVAYYASAEFGCFLQLGWTLPECVLDLYAEFRNTTNGLSTPCGRGLLGALTAFGLSAIEAAQKESMRALALRGGPYCESERTALLDYCQADVDALGRLVPRMADLIDVKRSLLRGRYMRAVAVMEHNGIPIDRDTLADLRQHWDGITCRLIEAVDSDYGVYAPAGSTLKPGTQFGRAVFKKALERGVDPYELADAAGEIWQREWSIDKPLLDARKAARRATGLTVGKLNRWEDSGKDCSTWPRLDNVARNLAGEYPELGIGPGYVQHETDDTDYASQLWELLREDDPKMKPKHHPAILEEAAELVFGSDQPIRRLSFKADRWAAYLADRNIPWPRLESGGLALDDDTFRQMARRYPAEVGPIRELRHTLGQLRLNELAVGVSGRNRCLLSPFGARSGRNTPSNSKFIFGPPAWLRSLIKPEPGRAVAYVDWSQQEFAIAGALSGDANMMEAYTSGDPYLAFAKQAGAVPEDATKQSHPRERSQYKICALAVQYGMGEESLARSLGEPPIVGRVLLRKHKQTYPDYWRWSQAATDHAILFRRLHTVFGWNLFVDPGQQPNPRALANFPCQANGAEMLRLACCLIVERGVQLLAPVHDAVLIEAAADEINGAVATTQTAMREAGEIILDGFQLRTDADVFVYPERYVDERGATMWERVTQIVAELKQSSGRPPTTGDYQPPTPVATHPDPW